MDNNTIYSRFSRWVKLRPDAVAVIEDGRSMTYRELDIMANSIMSKFCANEYKAVGIVMIHSAEMIAAMLAVLKSGAAYVPAEPTLPRQRIDYMMRTAGVGFMITDDYCRDLPEAPPLSDRSTHGGVAYLTAYFVPSHKNCQISRIKTFLRSRLADFMVPEFFVRMEEIPLTARGKVNDHALPVVMKEGGEE